MIEVVVLYLPTLAAFVILFMMWEMARMAKKGDRLFKELIEKLDENQKLWEEYLSGISKEDDGE